MVDFVSKEKRSKIMSSIKSKNTLIDRKVAALLRSKGISFKRYPKMSGNPDFIVNGNRIAIFCDGDFWHGHYQNKRKKELPKLWVDKIEANMARDKKNNYILRNMGWEVVRLWEHDINDSPGKCVKKILSAIKSGCSPGDPPMNVPITLSMNNAR